MLTFFKTQKTTEVSQALDNYSDVFETLLMLDFAGNQSEGLLQSSYEKFLNLYFRDILWICTYFKQHSSNIDYANMVLFRSINQVYGIDLSESNSEEPNNEESNESCHKRGRKPKFFHKDNDDTPESEIKKELETYDAVKMNFTFVERSPSIHEVAILLDLIFSHPKYSSIKNRFNNENYAVLNSGNMLSFWNKIEKVLTMIEGKLSMSYFSNTMHAEMKMHIESIFSNQMIKKLQIDSLNSPITDIKQCYCLDESGLPRD